MSDVVTPASVIIFNPARMHECAFEISLPLHVMVHPFPETEVASAGWGLYGMGRKVTRTEPYTPLSGAMWLPLRKFVFEGEAWRCHDYIKAGAMDLQGLIFWVSDVH